MVTTLVTICGFYLLIEPTGVFSHRLVKVLFIRFDIKGVHAPQTMAQYGVSQCLIDPSPEHIGLNRGPYIVKRHAVFYLPAMSNPNVTTKVLE